MVGPLAQDKGFDPSDFKPYQEPAPSAPPSRGFATDLLEKGFRSLASPSTPAQEAVKPSGKSVGGFGKELLDDGADTLKSLADALLLSWPRALREMYRIGIQAKWLTDPNIGKYIRQELGHTAEQVGDGIVEPYAKAFEQSRDEKGRGSVSGMIGNAAYHRPIGTLLDAMTIYDLGAGSVASIGKLTGARGLMEAGEAARHLPGKLIQGTIDKAAGVVGIDMPTIRDTIKLKGEALTQSRFEADVAKRGFENMYKAYSPEEKAMVDQLHSMQGTPRELKALWNDPKIREAYEAQKNFIKDIRETGLGERGYNVLSDAEMEERVAKQIALERDGAINNKTVAKAKADMDAIRKRLPGYEPLYKPTEMELRSGKNFMESLGEMPTEKPVGKVGFLERFSGKNPLSKDPAKYMSRIIDAYYGVKGNLDWISRIQQTPNLIKAVQETGENVPSFGIYKRYFETGGVNKAKAAFINQLVAEQGPKRALRMLLNDEDTKLRYAKANAIVLDPTVKNILKMEFNSWTGTPGRLLQVYDRMLSIFKAGATKYNPHFYTGNAVGDAVLFLLSGGSPMDLRRAARLKDVMPANAGMVSDIAGSSGKVRNFVEMFSEADKAGKAGVITHEVSRRLIAAGVPMDQLEAELRRVLPSVKNLGAAEVGRQQLHEQIARKVDALSTHDEVLAGLANQERQLLKRYNKVAFGGGAGRAAAYQDLQEVQQSISNVTSIRKQIISDYEANAIKAGQLEKMIPGLREDAALVRPAIQQASNFFGEYIALHPIAQYVFRRMIPFYAFNKAMAMLAFKLPFIAPRSGFMWNRYSIVMSSMMGDHELPEYARNWFPMFVRKSGDTVWFNLSSLAPFGGVGASSIGGVPIPKVMDIAQQNPFVSLAYQLKGGRGEFTMGTVPYGESVVSMHDGSVYQFTKDGKLVKTIEQLPLAKGVAHLFPTVQLAENLLIPYKMTDRGWLGNPEPILKPDGTVKYPKELWANAIRGVGGPNITIRNRDDIIRGEKLRVREAINEMKKAIGRASPEERPAMIQSVQDYIRGSSFGHIKK